MITKIDILIADISTNDFFSKSKYDQENLTENLTNG